jgi:methylmalonyl-CoA/ethylmalonyl-CoA epimerase
MPASTETMIQRIGQIAINTHDLERAVSFYRDTLGLRHLFTVPKMAFFECGSVRLMLGLPAEPRFDHPSSVIYFEVADIAEAHRTLVARGVTFESDPHLITRMGNSEIWMGFFNDSEGNMLALSSTVTKS